MKKKPKQKFVLLYYFINKATEPSLSLAFTFGLWIEATGLRLRSRTEVHIPQLQKTCQDLHDYINEKLKKNGEAWSKQLMSCNITICRNTGTAQEKDFRK